MTTSHNAGRYDKLKRRMSLRLKRIRQRARNIAVGLRAEEIGYTLALSELDGFRVAYRRNSSDEEQLRNSFASDPILPLALQMISIAAPVVLDVGAHIGTFALALQRALPQARTFAIEASEETSNYLAINLALNHANQVMPHRLALSDTDGTTRLYHGLTHLGHSITNRQGAFEIVPQTSLESFLDANAITTCDFAKFNCEGAEFPILLSAGMDVLQRIRSMIVLYHEDLAPQYELRRLVAHLEASGFDVSLRNQRRARGWLIASRSGDPE